MEIPDARRLKQLEEEKRSTQADPGRPGTQSPGGEGLLGESGDPERAADRGHCGEGGRAALGAGSLPPYRIPSPLSATDLTGFPTMTFGSGSSCSPR